MVDETNLGIQVEAQTEQAPVSQVETDGQTTTEVISEKPVESLQVDKEKKYNREQLAKAVKESTKNVYEKAYQDALKKIQDRQVSNAVQQTAPVQQQAPSQAQSQFDESRIREIAAQQAIATNQQIDAANYYNNIANQFVSKVEAARVVDPEIHKKLKEVLGMDLSDPNPATGITADDPRVVLFNSIDNLADVVAEMDRNPTKWTHILECLRSDIQSRSSLSFRELERLSESVKLNKAAKDSPKVPKPPTQIDPSNAGLSNGEPSISFERKKAQYRF